MAEPRRTDEEVAEQLLEVLRGDEAEAPGDLAGQTIQKVRSLITARDIIDLTTMVFVLRFCAPLLDLIAALLGHEVPPNDRRARHD